MCARPKKALPQEATFFLYEPGGEVPSTKPLLPKSIGEEDAKELTKELTKTATGHSFQERFYKSLEYANMNF